MSHPNSVSQLLRQAVQRLKEAESSPPDERTYDQSVETCSLDSANCSDSNSAKSSAAYSAAVRLPEASSAQLDAEVLLAFATGRTRSWLYAWSDSTLDGETLRRFEGLLQQRLQAYPVAYLTGKQEFWSLEFDVTPDVLIPRPDTELLIELALAHLHKLPSPRILELGTGSGAIALALASERADASIIATDVSAAALQVAGGNATRLAREATDFAEVEFIQSNWFEQLDGQSGTDAAQDSFDLIISNPPYLAENDSHLQGSIRYEPALALVSGIDGLQAIRTIAEGASAFLGAKGALMLEHGYNQADAIRDALQQAGYTSVEVLRDIAGLPRVTTAQRMKNP